MADQESSIQEFMRVKQKVDRLNQFFFQIDADYLFNEMERRISEDGVFYLEDFLDICEEHVDIINLQAYGWTSMDELKVLGCYNFSTSKNWYYILNLAEKLEDLRGMTIEAMKNREPYTFGQKLKMLRVAKGLTQEEMASKLGITRRAYIPYEQDKAKPRSKEIYQKMKDILGYDFQELSEPFDKKDDPVNHPSHYVSGGIECIDAIASALSCHKDPMAAWLTGQIMKYIWRWPLKNGLEDLKKARFYLDRLIKMEEEN